LIARAVSSRTDPGSSPSHCAASERTQSVLVISRIAFACGDVQRVGVQIQRPHAALDGADLHRSARCELNTTSIRHYRTFSRRRHDRSARQIWNTFSRWTTCRRWSTNWQRGDLATGGKRHPLHLRLRNSQGRQWDRGRAECASLASRGSGAVGPHEHKPPHRTGCGRLSRRNAVASDRQNHRQLKGRRPRRARP
jgi:hypothetical protein